MNDTGGRTFSSTGVSWHRGAIARGLSLGGKALLLFGILFGEIVSSQAGTAMLATSLGIFGIVMSYALWFIEVAAPGALRIEGEELVVDRRGKVTRIPVRDIESAWVTSRNVDGKVVPTVEIRTRMGTALSTRMEDPTTARGGRPVSEWKAAIRAALDPSYRANGATLDDAAAVLTSPSATVDQRLGAAIALRTAGEPKERIRIAADGATDARVRVALEAIAEDADDERLEKALLRLR